MDRNYPLKGNDRSAYQSYHSDRGAMWQMQKGSKKRAGKFYGKEEGSQKRRPVFYCRMRQTFLEGRRGGSRGKEDSCGKEDSRKRKRSIIFRVIRKSDSHRKKGGRGKGKIQRKKGTKALNPYTLFEERERGKVQGGKGGKVKRISEGTTKKKGHADGF